TVRFPLSVPVLSWLLSVDWVPLAVDQEDEKAEANPYPEVTDLFCRLPLSTLFYQLEAFHLGDLLR
ncbi:hypothetical protein CU097_002676, partial [Rhizopus azygosporus]